MFVARYYNLRRYNLSTQYILCVFLFGRFQSNTMNYPSSVIEQQIRTITPPPVYLVCSKLVTNDRDARGIRIFLERQFDKMELTICISNNKNEKNIFKTGMKIAWWLKNARMNLFWREIAQLMLDFWKFLREFPWRINNLICKHKMCIEIIL